MFNGHWIELHCRSYMQIKPLLVAKSYQHSADVLFTVVSHKLLHACRILLFNSTIRPPPN